MRFHHVVEGDPLDNHSDSKVVTGSYDCTIQGPDGRQRAQAYLRDKAYCGVCKTPGRNRRRARDAGLQPAHVRQRAPVV